MVVFKRRREVVIESGMILFVLFFVFLAITNLIFRVAIIPSILWLLFVLYQNWPEYKYYGMRLWLIHLLASFSTKHFAESIQGNDGSSEFRLSYQLLGCRFQYFTIPVNKVNKVNWSAGQASGMTGRDMDDWHVFLKFDSPFKDVTHY